MKARIVTPAAAPLVLAYGLPAEKAENMQKALSAAGVRYEEAPAAGLCQKVGYLCGLPGYAESPHEEKEPFPHEALVLCGFDSKSLHELLRLLRESDLRVERKAALTETNRDWSLSELLQEIDREHQAMKSQMDGNIKR